MIRKLLIATFLLSPSVAFAEPIQSFKISGQVDDTAWVILYADFDVEWTDGNIRRVTYTLASGSVESLEGDNFDFADGSRTLEDIQGIYLRVDPATGTPHGTVYWDCLVLRNVKVEYILQKNGTKGEIDILNPVSLVPEPGRDETKCTGVKTTRLY